MIGPVASATPAMTCPSSIRDKPNKLESAMGSVYIFLRVNRNQGP